MSQEAAKSDGKGKTVRVIGTIMKVGEEQTSKSGNKFTRLSVVVNDGVNEQGTWWNLTVMDNLRSKIVEIGAGQVLDKKSYAKFIGLGSQRPWTNKDGQAMVSNDMLVNAIELQNGTFVKADKKSEDEDAPF